MTSHLMTFVIPVRDHRDVEDWDSACARLKMTVHSCMAQDGPPAHVVIVAHPETPLPRFSNTVEIVQYPHEPVPLPPAEGPARHRAVRLDKGSRAMYGLIRSNSNSQYIMVVDYDDLVSTRLTNFLKSQLEFEHEPGPGYFIDAGYLFDDSRIAALRTSGGGEARRAVIRR